MSATDYLQVWSIVPVTTSVQPGCTLPPCRHVWIWWHMSQEIYHTSRWCSKNRQLKAPQAKNSTSWPCDRFSGTRVTSQAGLHSERVQPGCTEFFSQPDTCPPDGWPLSCKVAHMFRCSLLNSLNYCRGGFFSPQILCLTSPPNYQNNVNYLHIQATGAFQHGFILFITSSIPNYKTLWFFYIHNFCYVPRYILCLHT